MNMTTRANANENGRPGFLWGEINHTLYDGFTDDLLTGGMGHEGIQSDVPPGFADALQPTPAELRRRAIYESYRGLNDRTPGGPGGSRQRHPADTASAAGRCPDQQRSTPRVPWKSWATEWHRRPPRRFTKLPVCDRKMSIWWSCTIVSPPTN
jgi:hypothetical protein